MSFAPPLKDINQMANGEMASYGNDKKLIVRFTREPVYQEFESKGGIRGGGMINGVSIPGEMVEGAGHPVYKDMDFIEVIQPGGKSDSKRHVKLVDDEKGPSDPHRFPSQWTAFKNEQHQVADGLPLEQWPPLGKSQVLAFKAAGIFTVEQLSSLADSAAGAVNVMDARKYRDMAVKYFETAKGSAPVEALMRQMEQMQQDMEILRNNNELLAANQKKTPGRKPVDQGE